MGRASLLILIPVVLLTLYFAALFFRYEPIPSAENALQFTYVWDRFRGRTCVVVFSRGNTPFCSYEELTAATQAK